MDWSAGTTLFWSGALLGLFAAMGGALADYRINLRHTSTDRRGLPGCIFYVVGGLALTGIVAGIASLVLTGGLRAALIMGAGVFVGFHTGFTVIMLLWLLVTRQAAPPEPDVDPTGPAPAANNQADSAL